MTDVAQEIKHGENFAAVDLGEFADLDNYTFTHPILPFEVEGKVFLKSLLGLTSTEISINKVPPNTSVPFYHRHEKNEEIYIFIKGTGQFQVDDQTFPVAEGTIIRVAPKGARCWRNVSDEPLYYIVIQAPAEGYGKDETINDGKLVRKLVRWDTP